jgi:hypothetical protein
VPTGQEGTPPERSKGDGDLIRGPLLGQLPESGMADGLPMTQKEISNFALSLFAEALVTYRESFYEAVVSGSKFPVATAYIKGAVHAVMTLQAYQSGMRQQLN